MALSNRAKRIIKNNYLSFRRKAKKVLFAVPFWVLLVGVALTSTGIGRYIYLVNIRHDQDMASYWTADSEVPYRHMSVYGRGARPGSTDTPPLYINQSESLSRSDIVTMRTSLQTLADSGRSSSGKSGLDDDGRPRGWEDCFSSYLTGSIETVALPEETTAFNMTSTCDVVAVEGNYAVFHPFSYMSGGFLPETVTDSRQIVLNDVLAWKFYKSYDVIGNKVKLWGQEFTIIGVVTEPNDGIANSAGTNNPRVYVYFTAMENFAPLTSPDSVTGSGSNGNNSSQAQATPTPAAAAAVTGAAGAAQSGSTSVRPTMAVMCYEAMLPEAVPGVAKNDMSSSVPNYNPATPNFYVISNTERFGVLSTWRFMWPIGKTQSALSVYDFPFWEKTAQLTQQHLFADEILTVVGVLALCSGTVMAILRHRKMSRK